MPHLWGKEPVPGSPDQVELTCERCGFKTRYKKAGDVYTERTALINGQWVVMGQRKAPECKFRFTSKSKKKKRRVYTEAQEVVFRMRIPPKRL